MNFNKQSSTQNSLILQNLIEYYEKDNNLEKILPIINGTSNISIRNGLV